jgi:antitoxin MazE
MKLLLVQIGNSWGIRIPKALLQQCKFKKSVRVTIVNGTLVLSADKGPREGWENAFKKMATTGDDQLLEQDLFDSNFDKDEWKW